MTSRRKKTEQIASPIGLHDPRRHEQLIGHQDAVQHLESAFQSQRPAHGWLITGPEGIGKATLIYHMARRLLSQQPSDAALPAPIPADAPVARRIAESAHADLRVIEPESKGSAITVDQIRSLHQFIRLTAAESGWRIIIIDPAETMNVNAANALLKLLEEPPPQALIFLISHAPGRLLPTIRSRCRVLAVKPLEEQAFHRILSQALLEIPDNVHSALFHLSSGSPGLAIQLHEVDGQALYEQLLRLFEQYPALDYRAILALGDTATSKQNPTAWSVLQRLFQRLLHQIILTASTGSATPLHELESQIVHRLTTAQPLDFWLELWDEMHSQFEQDAIFNLDRRQLLVSLCSRMAGAMKVQAA